MYKRQQQTVSETPKEIDIRAILQQIARQMQEQSLQQAQTSKQIQEQLAKQIQEQSLQQPQQIQQLALQITQQSQIIKDEVAAQLNDFKRENQEVLKQFRLETNIIIRDEINSINAGINNRFNDTEKQIKESDEKHSNDIKLINMKLIANSKRCDESFAAHKLEVEKLKELERKIDSNSDETNLKLQQIQSDVRTKIALVNASPITRSITQGTNQRNKI